MTRRALLLAITVFAAACGDSTTITGTPGTTTNPNQQNPGTPTTPTTPTTPNPTPTPGAGSFVKRTVVVSGVSYPYQVFIPAGHTSATRAAIILSVHGSGERGTDGDKQMLEGLAPVISTQRTTFPALAVFPQIPPGETFDRPTMTRIVMGALDAAAAEFNADITREYATGYSFGGGVIYEAAYANPTRFAAIAPMSSTFCDACVSGQANATTGSAYPLIANALKAVPFWVYHGSADQTAPVTKAQGLVNALRSAGDTQVKYTEYAGFDHVTTWRTAYASADFYAWLFAQHR